MKQKIKINLIIFLGSALVSTVESSLVSNNSLVSNTVKLVNTLNTVKGELPPALPPRRHGPTIPPREPRTPARTFNTRNQVEVFLRNWQLKRKIARQELVKSVDSVRSNLEGILNWLTNSDPNTGGRVALAKMTGTDLRIFKQMVRSSMDNIKDAFSDPAPSWVEIQVLAEKILKAAKA